MFISLIIPTYNRGKILEKLFTSLEKQNYNPLDFEVIIVNDGSTDSTKEIANKQIKKSKIKISIFNQKHKGPAAARNLGLKNAKGEIVLFLGDDIIANKKLLAEHASWQKKFSKENIAVLGYVTWSPEIEVTELMNWLEENGIQFAYKDLKRKRIAKFTHLYTSNISFKKNFLIENGLFDEDFPYAAYEDLELGYRLHKKGLKILYNQRAIGYHYHKITMEDLNGRLIKVGQSAKILFRKHPELKDKVAIASLTTWQKIRRLIDPVLYFLNKPFRVKAIIDRYLATKLIGMYMKGFSGEI